MIMIGVDPFLAAGWDAEGSFTKYNGIARFQILK